MSALVCCCLKSSGRVLFFVSGILLLSEYCCIPEERKYQLVQLVAHEAIRLRIVRGHQYSVKTLYVMQSEGCV